MKRTRQSGVVNPMQQGEVRPWDWRVSKGGGRGACVQRWWSEGALDVTDAAQFEKAIWDRTAARIAA
eukprot:7013112-Pyramimonas_sp.AAC.1